MKQNPQRHKAVSKRSSDKGNSGYRRQDGEWHQQLYGAPIKAIGIKRYDQSTLTGRVVRHVIMCRT